MYYIDVMASRHSGRLLKPFLVLASAATVASGVIYISYRPRNLPGSDPADGSPAYVAGGITKPPRFPTVKGRDEQIADLKRSAGVGSDIQKTRGWGAIWRLFRGGDGFDRAFQAVEDVQEEPYDLLVIGGGATGSGIALDAATRGLKVAVVERDDFSSGTSSKSTKLVHGGVRYLEKAVWDLDYNQYYWLGTKCYDLLAGSENIESSYFLTRSKALDAFPMLKKNGLVGALVYYDGAHNDSRMNVSLAMTAALYGATVVNHLEVTGLEKDGSGKLCGAIVKDLVAEKNGKGPQEFKIKAKGLIDPSTSDGRVIFFLPWQGNTIAGTTDAPTEITAHPLASEKEIDWILAEIRRYLAPDINVRRGDVLAAWSGIRPLVRDPKAKNTESLVRNHLVDISESGLLTIAGGKWTTYRQMAEEGVDEAIRRFHLSPRPVRDAPRISGTEMIDDGVNLDGSCQTHQVKLVGAHGYSKTLFIRLIQHFGVETDVARHLVDSYGDRAWTVAALSSPTDLRFPVRGVRLSPLYPFIDGEVRYAVRHEYAQTAADVLSRRTRLAFLNAQAALEALPKVIDIMGEELKWDSKRKELEWRETVPFLASMGLPKSKLSASRKDVESGKIATYETDEYKLYSRHDGPGDELGSDGNPA
ncbi:hypothetical protein FGG08_007334 [Glutinoglossum americanum]|uniref:Glycerol-3-phosphate dehydrogenase n=1 Tax=Glutinoglossum americanum TaxID=1670608 RepID=A0A9P8I5K1_9PEZI|nr:hypothetical protein FGG08_007334 [Glutinoglossum americanum]